MPGIVGWLGCARPPLVYPAVVSALRINAHQTAVEVDGVNSGCLTIIHPQINPAGWGHFSDPSSGRTVAFWGEFYGGAFDACSSGEEVCRVLLSELGDRPLENLDRIDGSFVLFFQEPGRQIIAADRLSSRPLYYCETGGGVAFGPELKTFAHLSDGRPGLNRNALVAFLVNGYPVSDQTYYSGAFLLRPGFFLEVKAGAVTKGAYTRYVPSGDAAPDPGIDTCREELAGLLLGAVRKRLRNIAHAVIPISGGYDSRGILACVRELYGGPLDTVTFGTGEDDPSADAAVGRRVAAFFGTRHQFFRRGTDELIQELERGVSENDAANTDAFAHPHEPALIHALRASGHTLIYRGEQCFGCRPAALSRMEALGRVGIYELHQYPGLFSLFHPHLLQQAMNEQRQNCADIIAACGFEDWSFVKESLYLEQLLFRMMNFSNYNKLAIMEVRTPWLDRDVLRFYSRIPVAYRHDKSLYRSTLRHMFPALMDGVPIAARNSLERWDQVLRGNQAFLGYARKNLVHDTSPIHDIWRREAIAALIDGYERGGSSQPLRVRLADAVKPLVRTHLHPLYRALKRSAPASVSVRSMAPQDAIGRLLILKLWCDKWA